MIGCDYANARIGAMRGRLLGRKGIEELLAQPDLQARLDQLKKTDYGPALAARLGRGGDPLRDAERGLRARLADDLLRIDRFLDERTQALFRAATAFEDAWSLKTILRGIARREPPERILLLLAPTPGLDEPALEELVGQSEVKGVLDLLATWASPYAAPLADALERSTPRGDLFLAEIALDRFVFARALDAARRDGEDGRILHRLFRAQVDLTNAGTLLKLASAVPAEELFIPGGRLLGPKRFAQLGALPERERRDALARRKRLRLDPRVVLAERGEPAALDQALRRALREAVRHSARVHPLSLAVPLDFFLSRQDEIRRIRLVLRGAEFEIPAPELLALLEG